MRDYCMHLYNADRKNSKNKSFILKHLGTSPIAAAERVEGMFSHQQLCSFSSDFSVNVHDISGNIIQTKTLEQHLVAFCNYVKSFSISEYSTHANRPLRLVDLWEDDPIGSAGPMIVEPSEITLSEQREVQDIFSPFSDVVYPQHIFNVMSKKSIKGIKRHYINNVIFTEELKKRKIRSKAIGEDFSQVQYQEIVWLDLTFKFKAWALCKGYDSFVYSNTKEGNGEDTFITLLPNQLKSTGKIVEFLKEKYLEEMPSIIKEMVNGYRNNSFEVAHHALWGQRNPMSYWE